MQYIQTTAKLVMKSGVFCGWWNKMVLSTIMY